MLINTRLSAISSMPRRVFMVCSFTGTCALDRVEWCPEALAVCHLLQRFTPLPEALGSIRRIPKWEHGNQLEPLGDVEQTFDPVAIHPPNPATAEPFLPGDQLHAGNGPCAVDERRARAFGHHHDGQRGLRQIRPRGCHRSQLLEGLPVLHHDEMPGLSIALAWRPATRCEDLLKRGLGHDIGLELSGFYAPTYAFKNAHHLFAPLQSPCTPLACPMTPMLPTSWS